MFIINNIAEAKKKVKENIFRDKFGVNWYNDRDRCEGEGTAEDIARIGKAE